MANGDWLMAVKNTSFNTRYAKLFAPR